MVVEVTLRPRQCADVSDAETGLVLFSVYGIGARLAPTDADYVRKNSRRVTLREGHTLLDVACAWARRRKFTVTVVTVYEV